MLEHEPETKRLRFRLSTLLLGIAFIGLLIAWYTSMERERSRSVRLAEQLMTARLQIRLSESRAKIQSDTSARSKSEGEGTLQAVRFDRVSLRGAVIQAGNSAFQKTVFDHSDLTGATLTGGGASFQGASFKNAILRNANLSGGGSSFQLATFENADLSGARLSGNLQGMSLRNAKCFGTTIAGSFQGANIDAAQFQNADLSAIESVNLVSCYYDVPPTYNANTKFPTGFDPVAQGWKQNAASPQDD